MTGVGAADLKAEGRKNRVVFIPPGGQHFSQEDSMTSSNTAMRRDDPPIMSDRPMFGSDYHRIAEAIRFIESRVEEQPSLRDVASHLGLSPFHFQRLFRRWAGITPKDFLQFLTLGRAKRQLAASTNLLETSMTVGLSGPGRLHDLFLSLEAVTPGEFKRGGAGLEIAWGVHPTPLGDALFATTGRGLCGLFFVEARDSAREELRARWPAARLREDANLTAPTANEVARRMRGLTHKPLRLVLKGTPFQIQVWAALLSIPEGQVTSYRGLALRSGAPSAARAVGTALGANPIGYLIPCHRVIRETGAIGDYRWGGQRKAILLALESARSHARAPSSAETRA
jgi:AraC family transcriptional regulator of adaptative response/methylated-DNA-[protein]-cysteine methyltransferase